MTGYTIEPDGRQVEEEIHLGGVGRTGRGKHGLEGDLRRERKLAGQKARALPYESASQGRTNPKRCASSNSALTEEGCHLLPPRAGRSPI
ncbi:hypothetical protein GA0061101_12631 [Rhizobium lusitanum]|uniref:Uncharacterized protein n=1 Tax=Rhizobium lusitanum TaxID=293958 RepID=A0A1C3X668_9HYPH|nr:hypothetical protein GA0061101_12631 [Rhizobium lusitanum]